MSNRLILQGCLTPLAQDERALEAAAKQRVQSGQLPRAVRPDLLAGHGDGSPCALCDQPVTGKQIEYIVQNPEGAGFRFHIRCHEIWRTAQTDTGKP